MSENKCRKLSHTELRRFCDIADLGDFESRDDSDLQKNIIGQSRALAAFEFGLSTRRKGYNIFAVGINGSGKTSFARHFAGKAAKEGKRPNDLCYVYNFKEPKSPMLLSIEAGYAQDFKEDMEDMIAYLQEELPQTFSHMDFVGYKNDITKRFEKRKSSVMKDVTEVARSNNFEPSYSGKGMFFSPIINGKTLTEEEFDELPTAEKDAINASSDQIHDAATMAMHGLRQIEIDQKKEIGQLEYNTALFIVGHQIGQLFKKYESEADIVSYLKLLKEDILENIDGFVGDYDDEEEEMLQSLLPWMSKKATGSALSKYRVNIIADHRKTEGAPVIEGINPTYANIIGEVEFDSEFGNLTTDYMKIKPGLMHEANGGYLILQARDVLSIPHLWESLKRIIKTGEISIESQKEYSSGLAVSTIRPQTVPLDIKIILVGISLYHDILKAYDEDFADLFKVAAYFDYEIAYNEGHLSEMARFVRQFAADEHFLKPDSSAILQLMEYSTRIAQNQNKLTGRFDKIIDILTESHIWAKKDAENSLQTINSEHVKKAIKSREFRLGLYEEKFSELMENNTIMIESEGKKIGQINGLAALDYGDMLFANPTKITATTYVGKAGIVNIENEAQMSGEIHDKGVQIVIGYLGYKYAQNFPLSLSCRVCFEQNYSGIDGDSASSTELYCILSSLAQMPINQGIAVTGSINQFGEIQPVGAITPKIEGFFKLCKKRGLNGKQGVIIPWQNIPDLVLNDEVIEAVETEQFHIYSISTIDQGIEILMDISAGEASEDEENTLHSMVLKRLKEFNEASMEDEE